MTWIRKIIENYPKWNCFLERIEIIEEKFYSSPDLCVETAKSLIEAVCKKNLQDKGIAIPEDITVQKLIKLTIDNIPFLESLSEQDQKSITLITSSLGNISKSIGEIRNNHGFISHGDNALKEKVDVILSELVLHSMSTVTGFLLLTHSNENSLHEKKRLYYEDYKYFNNWYDESYESVVCGNYTFKASTVLFQNDITVYREELISFLTEENPSIKEELENE